MKCFLFLASNSGLSPDNPSSREPSKTPTPPISPRDQDSLEEQDKSCLVPVFLEQCWAGDTNRGLHTWWSSKVGL